MVTGGNDTATGMLAGAACLLTERRDAAAALLADPALVPNAVEEILRLTSPVQNLARTTTRDVTIRDVDDPAGRKVLLGYAAANRDPREFGPTAETLDVRRRIAKILAFSYGTHYCIGAAAARLQGASSSRDAAPLSRPDAMPRATTCAGTCPCPGAPAERIPQRAGSCRVEEHGRRAAPIPAARRLPLTCRVT
jgi:hypothetical protein